MCNTHQDVGALLVDKMLFQCSLQNYWRPGNPLSSLKIHMQRPV